MDPKDPGEISCPTDFCRPLRAWARLTTTEPWKKVKKRLRLDPDFAIGYENVAFAYIYLNRLTEAEAVLHKAAERKIEAVRVLATQVLHRFSERQLGGDGKGSDSAAGKGSSGMV